MNACTIIARNYLAHARVLAESFLEHHPGSTFSALILDDPDGEIGRGEPFEVLRPEQIGLERREFHHMAMLYSLLALSTAVKPWLLRALLDRGYSDVSYLDPDIQFFAPIDDVSELARQYSIVLTPHATEPIPNDGLYVSEQTILQSGAFNLGFVAVSSAARDFLDWWSQRLARDCRIAHAERVFVDQRCVDLVPALFEHVILRDPTVNVAYWNAHSRRVEWTGERYEVGGQPLRFFHFSGFDPEQPWLLSKFQGDRPRVLLSENPGLARFCREYAEALLGKGYEEMVTQRYRFEKLPNGVPIDDRMRQVYRKALEKADQSDEADPPNPFDPAAPNALLDWLNEPIDESGISRYLLDLLADRPLSQVAFPDIAGEDGQRFVDWIIESGHELEHIPFELLPSPKRMERRSSVSLPEDLAPGVNVVGYLTAELGLGEAARQLIGALEAAEIPCSTIVYRKAPSRQAHTFREDGLEAARYDINLLCINAAELPEFRRSVGPELFSDRYSIGLWWWEASTFPKVMYEAFDLVDEVWTGTEFVRTIIAAHTSKPVVKVPLPIAVPTPPVRSRAELGLPDGFLFLFSFDFFSTFKRKNPLGAVEAFKRAFAPGEGAQLVVKSINGNWQRAALEQLRWVARDRPDIHVVDGYLDAQEKNALMASCDCYVSLHRSEGFGLTLAEAMSYGKPVLATAYGGNTDFLTEENSYLVPYELTTIGQGAGHYPAEGHWAEPDLDEAVRLMRHVFEHQDEARERAQQGRADLLESHSRERAASCIAERLAQIRTDRHEARSAPATPSEEPTTPSGLERAVSWVRHGPANPWEGPSRLGALGRFARRAFRRVLRPYEIRQREFELAVVEALKEDHHRIVMLESDQQDEQGPRAGARGAVLETYMELMRTATGRRATELHRELSEVRERMLEIRDSFEGTASKTAALLQEQRQELVATIGALDAKLADLCDRLHPRLDTGNLSPIHTLDDGRPVIGYEGAAGEEPQAFYRAFEDIFRGSEETIRERQRLYVELLEDHQPVLDLGCGRGELLDLLEEAGVEARGVDVDPAMIQRCRDKGHAVEQVEGIAYLEGQEDGSLGAIFSAHVIEHLPFESLVRLFTLAHRKLTPRGVLILETVNVHALQAFKAFWIDPTHVTQVFPEVAVALCRFAGFESARVMFPGGTGDLDTDLRTRGDYAVIAEKDALAR